MIEIPRDISKLLSLNLDLSYLLKRPDGNTPDRIFDAIAAKLSQMQYCLVHKDDMREAPDHPEKPAPPAEKPSLSSELIPIESEQ